MTPETELESRLQEVRDRLKLGPQQGAPEGQRYPHFGGRAGVRRSRRIHSKRRSGVESLHARLI
jgi:hypothetical protein